MQEVESAATVPRTGRRRSEALPAFFFLLPNIAGFLLFTLVPIIAAFALSLYDWPLISEPKFIGFGNYIRLFAKDPLFGQVIWNTLVYVVFYVAANLVVSLALAVWLSQEIRGIKIFRAIFFLPVLVPPVAISLIWQWIYAPGNGLINALLAVFGLQGPNWLGDTHWAMASLILMSVWQLFGYNMLIFIAGIKGIPQALYESASIDGAGGWARFWWITVPMLSPSIFFAMVMTLITSFQTFDQVFVLTNGGPGSATEILGLYVYNNAFLWFRMGYGAAVAVIMFLFILAVTILQMRLQRKWVHYETA
jgi:multiple sugar transport system permease protein